MAARPQTDAARSWPEADRGPQAAIAHLTARAERLELIVELQKPVSRLLGLALDRECAYEPLTGFLSDRIRPDSSDGSRHHWEVLGRIGRATLENCARQWAWACRFATLLQIH